ncbi:MAG: lipoate--protein ligase family protein [Anaerolineales bacterium]|nr:lipoate--protein ligase family protein [Anaerolineales bacterium]
MNHWRLIFDASIDGPTNMAIDHTILEAVGAGEAMPTLRLYAWEPPCLSLGYNQNAAEVDETRLDTMGWGLVRRATGGKAILHTDELTYSITLPQDSPLVAGGILESYRRLSQALLMALNHLGLHPQSTPHEQAGQATGAVCFEVPSNYEITAQGHKLIGSAQVRRLNAVLQHGSLPLSGDISRICDALVFESEAARASAKQRVLERAITVERALGVVVTWEAAAQALTTAFAETFDVEWIEAALTSAERQRVEQLRLDTYTHPDWTYRH